MLVVINAFVIATGALAVITNGILLIILIRDPLHFFKGTTTYFIISLSVADMVTGANACFWGINFFHPDLLDHQTYLLALFWTTIQASFLTLLAMSVERFLIVRYPFDCRRWITKKRVCLSIALIWLVSIVLGGLILLPSPQILYVQFSIYTEFFVSVFVIVVLYTLIILRVRQSKKGLRDSKFMNKDEKLGAVHPVGGTSWGRNATNRASANSSTKLVSSADENDFSENVSHTQSGAGTTSGGKEEASKSQNDKTAGDTTPGDNVLELGTLGEKNSEKRVSGNITSGNKSDGDETLGDKSPGEGKTSLVEIAGNKASEDKISGDKTPDNKTSQDELLEVKTPEAETSIGKLFERKPLHEISKEKLLDNSLRNGSKTAGEKYQEVLKLNNVSVQYSPREDRQQLHKTGHSGTASRRSQQEKKLTVVVLILVGVLIVTILPYLLVSQIYVGYILFCRCAPLPGLELFVSIYFPIELLNFAVNPLIYAWRLPQYRRTLRYMFSCGKARKELRGVSLYKSHSGASTRAKKN